MKITDEKTKQRRYEIWECGCYLRKAFFRLARRERNCHKLSYEAKEVKVGFDTCLVYDIPPEDMQSVLDELNPLGEDVSFPVNECNKIPFMGETQYYFRDAKIIYYDGCNFIVTPIFFSTGATIEGWGIRKNHLSN